jgi:hypothetical protein
MSDVREDTPTCVVVRPASSCIVWVSSVIVVMSGGSTACEGLRWTVSLGSVYP